MVRKEDLLKTLEDLTDEEFKDFKCLLKDESLAGYQTIRACRLQKAERRVTVDLMVKTYQLPAAVEATKKLLKKINRNDLLQRLSDRSSGPEAQSQEEWKSLHLHSDAVILNQLYSQEHMNFSDDLGVSKTTGPSSRLPRPPHPLPEVYEDDSTILDKFTALHIDDVCGDVDEEVSEVTPHHVKSSEPTLSLRAVLMQLGFPVKIKCNVLIYYKLNPSSLNLHVYLIPNDPGVQKRVDDKENKHGYKEIRKPHPDRYLGMEQIFILTADMNTAKVTPPQGLTLRYHSSEPNFYEVVIKNPDRDVNLKLKREEPVSEPVWTCGIEEDDYSNSGEGGTEMQRRIHVETLTPADSYPPQTRSSGGEVIPMSQIQRREEHPAFDQSPFIQEEEDDTTIKENILKLLQRLSEEEFKDFKWYLQNEKSRPIPQSKLEKADRTHVVDLIEQTYGHQAVKVIKDIFKKMKRNDLVRRL